MTDQGAYHLDTEEYSDEEVDYWAEACRRWASWTDAELFSIAANPRDRLVINRIIPKEPTK